MCTTLAASCSGAGQLGISSFSAAADDEEGADGDDAEVADADSGGGALLCAAVTVGADSAVGSGAD